MKKILYSTLSIAFLSSVLFLGSCKKTTSVNGLVQTEVEVATVNGVATTTNFTFTYDGQGRQILKQVSGSTVSSVSYNYGSSGQVVQTTTGTNAGTVTYTLNSQGLASSDGTNTYSFTNGYLTTEDDAAGNSLNSTVSNGNVTGTTVVEGGVTTIYAYQFSTTQDYRNFGLSFLGKRNTDLVSSESVTSTGTPTQYTITYTYDSQGRVLQQTLTPGGSTSYVYTYTYTSN